MDRRKILIADDEPRLRKLIGDYLKKSDYEPLEAGDGREALAVLDREPDTALAILDVMMPYIDGLTVCREIRRTSRIPVIILTAKSEELDELNGFDAGADEYVTKPFSPRTLVARVDALLRRTAPAESDCLEIGGIRLDVSAHTVTVDGKPVELSYKEFELLRYFMENRGIALSREKFLNNVWNYDYFGDARTVDTHVKKLRSKLGDKGSMIRTVWGVGYKFDTDREASL